MNNLFFYKALSPEYRYFSHTPPDSFRFAKGTLYEAWFNCLQLSPWYRDIAETRIFPSDKARECWEHFGDIRNVTFEEWWLNVGYQIFAEQVPYRELRVAIDFPSEELSPPILKIEVPLNLSPQMLQEQFKLLLEAHKDYDKYDRWEHSTARVHQRRESRLTYQSIMYALNLYKKYESISGKRKITLDQFATLYKLNPRVKIEKTDRPSEVREKKAILANNASHYLKKAKYLMANATELLFPCDDRHSWVVAPRDLN